MVMVIKQKEEERVYIDGADCGDQQRSLKNGTPWLSQEVTSRSLDTNKLPFQEFLVDQPT